MLRPLLGLAAIALLLPGLTSAQQRPTDAEIRDRALKAFGPGAQATQMQSRPTTEAAVDDMMRRAVGDITQESAEAKNKKLRNQILKSMGYDVEAGQALVFVSDSMDDQVIRAYAREAMWAGATLVTRGIPANMDFQGYINQKLATIVKNKGPVASIQIDPRLFDRFGVTQVPTIVWDEDPAAQLKCLPRPTTRLDDGNGGTQGVRSCEIADEKSYYKLAGQVTIDYALEAFAEAGSKKALARLNRLRDYNTQPGKDQEPFSGDWETLATPKQEAEVERVTSGVDDAARRIEQAIGPIFEPLETVP